MLAAVLCVLAAGCGGGSSTTTSTRSTFRAGYLKLRGPLNQTGTAIAAEITASPHQTDAQVASAFAGLAGRFHRQLATLEALKPPPSLSSAFAAATTGATRMDADLRAVSVAATKHDADAARKATAALGRDLTATGVGAAQIKRSLGIK